MIITKDEIINLLNECTTISSSSAPMSFVGTKTFPIQEDAREPKVSKTSKINFEQRLKNLRFRRTGY